MTTEILPDHVAKTTHCYNAHCANPSADGRWCKRCAPDRVGSRHCACGQRIGNHHDVCEPCWRAQNMPCVDICDVLVQLAAIQFLRNRATIEAALWAEGIGVGGFPPGTSAECWAALEPPRVVVARDDGGPIGILVDSAPVLSNVPVPLKAVALPPPNPTRPSRFSEPKHGAYQRDGGGSEGARDSSLPTLMWTERWRTPKSSGAATMVSQVAKVPAFHLRPLDATKPLRAAIVVLADDQTEEP